MTSPEAGAIVFVGPMGAGKTSIGKRVARALQTTFSDTDKAVAAEHGPIPAIFAEHGEAQFRRWERLAVQNALAAGGVVALGGGAVLDPHTRADLARHRVILLTVDPHVVASRIRGGRRPLLEGDEDPVARWSRIAQERRPLYDEIADVRFDTSRGPLQSVVESVTRWIRAGEAPS